jgi:deoxyguanosine kinase
VPASLISVIGPPAAGKTTLAELLAEELPAGLIREDYAGNPFLSDSYLRGGEFALPSQLYFLFSRLSQLNLQAWPAGGVCVTDYGFCQDAVYAGISLSGEELALYRRLAAGAEQRVKAPDVLVQLDGPEELLLERIARRGRPHERVFSAEFLASMRRAYWKIVTEAAVPVVTVDVQQVDLLAGPGRPGVLKAVREALK